MRFFLLLFLSACAPLETITRDQAKSGGVGFAAGVATAKTAEVVKKTLTPEFKVQSYPQKLCERIQGGLIQCLIVPCAVETEGKEAIEAHCITRESEDAFWEREVKVESLDTSAEQLSAVKNFCERLPHQCVIFSGQFKNQTILFQEAK